MCTPAWWHASITGRIARTPARWPATRGRCRCRAQRPFPSMMMPICRGRSARAGSGTAAGAGGCCIVGLGVRTDVGPQPLRGRRASDLEDLRLLSLSGVVDAGDELVGDLLHLGELAGDLVLADMAVLLDAAKMVDLVAADVAHRDAGFLGLAMHELHKVLATLLGELRDGDADHLTVVARVESEIALLYRLLDGAERAAVVGLDDQHARLGNADPREALQRRRGSVVLDVKAFEQRGRGASGAHRHQLAMQRLDALLHSLVRVGDPARDLLLRVVGLVAVAHSTLPSASTRVPICSPRMTRSMFPSVKRSKTMIGIRLSMHSVTAVLSMIASPRLSTSMYVRLASRVAVLTL